jgi:hypothetical protein
LDELARLYDNPSEPHKEAILICFVGSDDARGLPLFNRTLDKEENMMLRLSAAGGLAHWNIRRGVAELIRLFESTELPSGRFYPVIGDRARDSFQKLNQRKGWAFPDEEIRKSIESRPGIDREQAGALYNAEMKKWFTENQDRFPDWKPGDPLPKTEPTQFPKEEPE